MAAKIFYHLALQLSLTRLRLDSALSIFDVILPSCDQRRIGQTAHARSLTKPSLIALLS